MKLNALEETNLHATLSHIVENIEIMGYFVNLAKRSLLI